MEEGKIALISGEYERAAEIFGEQLQNLTDVYGELGQECGDAYYYYGKALFGCVAQKNSLLQGGAQEEEEEEEEEEEGEGEEAIEQEEGVQGKEENKETVNEQSGSTETSAQPEEEKEKGDDEVAFEVLEVARLIYSRSDDEASKKKLANVLMVLGDLALEIENIPQGIEDYERSLEVQKQIYSDHDRELAEIYYKVGIAHQYNNSFDIGRDNMKKAIEILENRIKVLEATLTQENGNENEKGKGKGKSKEDETNELEGSQNHTQKEIEELKELIERINEKLEDILAQNLYPSGFNPEINQLLQHYGIDPNQTESPNTTASTSTPKFSFSASTNPTNTNSTTTTSSLPVNDLSSLVRKKKPENPKPENENEDESSQQKKKQRLE